MSSGPQACRDDEDEWDRLEIKLGIKEQNWKVYSMEAFYAKEGNREYKLTDSLLVKYVAAKQTLVQAQADFNKKLKILLVANAI